VRVRLPPALYGRGSTTESADRSYSAGWFVRAPRGAPAGMTTAMIAVGLALATAAETAIGAPVRVTLDGVAGARPGMTAAQVSQRWGLPLRPSYEVRPDCGQALVERSGVSGYALFTPRDRFGAVFFRRGVMTGRGIRVGSTLAQLRDGYGTLSSRPDRYIHGGRQYFLRRSRVPHWELRFDVGPRRRVTQIAFGERRAIRVDEGCA
jgi:hypothetical protein